MAHLHCSIRLAAALALAALLSWPASAAEIQWSVVHRMPLLEQSDFNRLKEVWDKEVAEPKTMQAFVIRRMENKKGNLAEYLIANPTVAATRHRWQLQETGPVLTKIHVPGTDCAWTIEPPVKDQVPTRACEIYVHLPRDVEHKIAVRNAAGVESSTLAMVKDVLIVAMGDSYSSGEGAPDRPALYEPEISQDLLRNNDWFTRGPGPTPAQWYDQACHRSLLSWQPLAALRLALERTDVIVRLLYTSCSGAEFFDGLLVAQSKKVETKALREALVDTADGEGKRRWHAFGPPYLPRSQVNAVRDELCEWDTELADVKLAPPHDYRAQWRLCRKVKPKMTPDLLLISAGGNDVKFSGAVGGTLLADKAKYPFGQPFLGALRNSLRLISPPELKSNIDALTPNYKALLSAVVEGALASPHKTILMRYPNPIGTDREAGGRVGTVCYEKDRQERIKNSFLAFSASVRGRLPFKGSWSVEFHPSEVNYFATEAFPSLQRMLDTADAVKVGWLDAAPTSYDRRLLCTDHTERDKLDAQRKLEPTYFCQVSREGGLPDRCKAFELATWNSELPGRRLINSTNDAVLAQRTWVNATNEDQFLVGASGTFHPNAEAHSVAADSAFAAMCRVLSSRQVCRSR